MMERNDPRLVFIPIEQAATPPDGFRFYQVYENRWWITVDDKLVFFRARRRDPLSPQCNPSEGCIRHIQKSLYPWATCVQVPVVCMAADPQDYV